MGSRAADHTVLVASPPGGLDELVAAAVARGHRVVRRSAGVALLVTDGHSIDVADDPRSPAVAVVGQTTERSPATVVRPADHIRRPHGAVDPELVARAERLLFGHFAIAVVDDGSAHLVTDRMGSVPLYRAEVRDGDRTVQIVGSGLEHVSHLAGRRALDPASVREFVDSGKVTTPFTAYRGVERIDAGTAVRIDADSGSVVEQSYWTPRESDAIGSTAAEVAPELLATMMRNLEALADRTTRALLFYSGGEDARVIGAMARRAGMAVEGVIFLEAANRELALARLSGRITDVPVHLRLRAADQYTAGLLDVIATTGPGVDAIDAHSRGLVSSDEADLFLDGWASDSYYKGMFAHQSRRRLGPLPIGLARPTGGPGRDAVVGRPDPPEPPDVVAEVVRRRRANVDRLCELRPRSGEEWGGLWPVSDHRDYGFFSYNRRTVPATSPYMWGNVIDVIRGLPESEKLNRRLFRAAFVPQLGLAGFVPRSGGEVPIAPPRTGVVLAAGVRAAFAVATRVRRRLGNPLYEPGPWHAAQLIRSSTIDAVRAIRPDVWEEVAEVVPPARLLAAGGGAVDEAAAHDLYGLHRVLQVATWLESGPGVSLAGSPAGPAVP